MSKNGYGPMVYLCGPIGGCTFEEANAWRESLRELLYPMMIVSPLRPFQVGNTTVAAYGEPGPGVADYSARFMRDYYDVMECDALFINFLGAKRKSIGSAMEIAWAFQRRIPVVVAMEPGNINEDLFLNFFAGVGGSRFDNLADAVNCLREGFAYPKYLSGAAS